jgi:transmembrane sensor
MTISSTRAIERIEDEAATWLVLLAEAPDDKQVLSRFNAWQQQDSLHAEIWARTTRAYDLVGKVANAQPMPTLVVGMPRRQSVGRAWQIAALAASIILAIFVAPKIILQTKADFTTSTGELRSVSLADGSKIEMGPDSAIALAKDGAGREVELLRGQAFFDVTPDPQRPFKVMVGETVATVLGTAFEVRMIDDGAAVAVLHGHVRVEGENTPGPNSFDLHAGEWVKLSSGQAASTGNNRPDEIADWMQGAMVARDRPISEIIDTLRRYYRGAIILQSDDFAERRVSGIYGLRDPARTLGELASLYGAKVTQLSPWITIVMDQ